MTSGGAICGSFLVFGGLAVVVYKPWRRRLDRKRPVRRRGDSLDGVDREGAIHVEEHIVRIDKDSAA